MASVWTQTFVDNKKPEKLAGRLSMESAQAAYEGILKRWPGGASKRISRYEAALYCCREHMLAGKDAVRIVWVEFHSPPSKPDPGEVRHVEMA